MQDSHREGAQRCCAMSVETGRSLRGGNADSVTQAAQAVLHSQDSLFAQEPAHASQQPRLQ